MEKSYVNVDEFPTFVTKFGCINNDTLAIAVVIPGNPGVADYYDEYLQSLYEESDCTLPVVCISHAGHAPLPAGQTYDGPSSVFTLHGQIQHKLRYIDTYIPDNVKLILIGHSIGCYIILHMLEHIPRDRVLLCPLLFLTVERMAVSPKGKTHTFPLRYLRWLLPLVALPFSFLPSWIHYKLFQWYFSNRPTHDGAIVATAKLVSPYCLRNVTNMANEEMQRVDVPDYHLLQRHRHKLWFYYGASDGWCPVKYCYDMLQRYPDADVTLCEHDIEHAFCLESSYKMAALTWKKLSQTVFKSPVCVVNNGIQQIQQS